MKTILFAISFLSAVAVADAVDPVGNLTVRQRWPFSRLVDMSFTLSGLTEPVDVAISFSNGSRKYEIPDNAISGDGFFALTNGTYRYVMDPALTGAGSAELLTSAKFKVEAKEIPMYMIVNIDPDFKGDRISYLTKNDIKNGGYGAWTEDYTGYNNQNRHADWDKFIWTGVTNDLNYSVTNMVFRRIPAGSMKMNWSSNQDSYISRPLYVSVFEFTRGYATMLKSDMGYSKSAVSLSKPLYNREYSSVRGSTNATDGVNWPETGHDKVAATSWIGRLRARTGGGILFDLPSTGQALYAYMGGAYSFGTHFTGHEGYKPENGAEKLNDDVADVVGRYMYNGGCLASDGYAWKSTTFDNMEDPDVGFAPVGSYKPNGFGLYDVAGNVYEMTLDYYSGGWGSEYLVKRTDPVGATYAESLAIAKEKGSDKGGMRQVLGGSAMNNGKGIVQTALDYLKNDGCAATVGFRVYAPVTRSMYFNRTGK